KSVVKVKISHKEELGSETLIYGDINLRAEGYTETPTRIIIKDNSGRDFMSGEIIDVAFNIERVHLFDKETELSVLPRVPAYNYLDCDVKGGKLKLPGAELELPEAAKCANLKGELLIPTDAITFDGDLEAEVISNENIAGVNLLALDLNGKRLYAIAPEAINKKIVNISIDFKKITVISKEETIVSPMPELNAIGCKFVKHKAYEEVQVSGKTKRKKVVRFGLDIAGTFFETDDVTSQKIFAALGIKKAFTTPLKIECGMYDFAITDNGIPATVEQVLDYGTEKFIKCMVGESAVYVKCDEELSGEIRLTPDFGRIGVVETQREIKII
ncbi:MAG: hypothetical protein K2G96_01240, partial [Clostridia bacterium]|nr:hypothetical protein [Clostridia bacterium]